MRLNFLSLSPSLLLACIAEIELGHLVPIVMAYAASTVHCDTQIFALKTGRRWRMKRFTSFATKVAMSRVASWCRIIIAHLDMPDTVALLQRVVRHGDAEYFTDRQVAGNW